MAHTSNDSEILSVSDTPRGLKTSGFSFRFELNELHGNE